MILNEDLFELVNNQGVKGVKKPINLDEALELDGGIEIAPTSDGVEIPETKTTDNAMLSIINNLIKEELDAVQLYNDAEIQCNANGYGQFAEVFKSIASEESVHIGELQKLLDEIQPTMNDDIEDGQQEAEEILDNVSDEPVEETPISIEEIADKEATAYWNGR